MRAGAPITERAEVRLLGPIEVHLPGRVVRPSPLEGRLLAVLALSAGSCVSIERITDVVWGARPPASVRNRVQALVSGLRRTLGETLVTRGFGYQLGVATDAAALARRVALARDSAAAGRLDEAAQRFRHALDLWRGEPFEGVATLAAEASQLRELRLAALHQRIAVELALGRHMELVGELTALVAGHPTREGLTAHLMLALYRSGRQADALDAYRALRTRLAADLGLDPGAELDQLHDRILRRDPTLDLPAVARPGHARPAQAPRDLPDFVGRAGELDALHAGLDTGSTVVRAIDGMGGMGKTTLAVRAAHRLADRFPDGQLFLDLRAHAPRADPVEPAAALTVLMRSIGVPPARIPGPLDERAAAWRSELAGRRVLVVLDDAASVEQVRPLLPGDAGCLVLITSRRRLAGLDGVLAMSLDSLPVSDGVALLRAIVGRRATDEPDAVADVLGLCGRLPLAIRIAGERLRHRPQWTVAYLADRLRDRSRRLAELAIGDRAVSTAFAASYRNLGVAERRVFRLLGAVSEADFDAGNAAALAGLPVAEAEHLLESLIDVHLLENSGPGRYRFHELLRDYGAFLGRTAWAIRPIGAVS